MADMQAPSALLSSPGVKVDEPWKVSKHEDLERQKLMLSMYYDAAIMGRLSDNGAKETVYKEIADEISEKYGMKMTSTQVKYKLDYIRKMYRWSEFCIGKSGWSYDVEKAEIKADDKMWRAEKAAFKKAYPKSGTNFVGVLKGRQLWFLDTARTLWKNSAATGDYAFDCTDSHSDEEEEEEDMGVASGSGSGAAPSPATPAKKRKREVIDLDAEDDIKKMHHTVDMNEKVETVKSCALKILTQQAWLKDKEDLLLACEEAIDAKKVDPDTIIGIASMPKALKLYVAKRVCGEGYNPATFGVQFPL